MITPTQGEHAQTALAHELFAAAQLAPGEGIEDAVSRIASALTATPAQPAAPQGVAEVNWWEADGDKYDASISPMQPAQGVAYAELPEPIWRTAQGVAFSERQLYDFADRTHALRASNGQAPAQPVALPSDRELQEIAMQAAWRHSREPDAPKYLPRSPVHAATWKPHAWVVAAMKDAIEAATQPKKDHHDELS